MHLSCKSSYHYKSIGLTPKDAKKWFWPNQVKLTWTSILTTQDQVNHGRPCILYPKITWEPPFSSYHEVYNLDLTWVFQLKTPWDLLSKDTLKTFHFKLPWDHHLKLSWEFTSQDIMASIISPSLLHKKWSYNPYSI